MSWGPAKEGTLTALPYHAAFCTAPWRARFTWVSEMPRAWLGLGFRVRERVGVRVRVRVRF